MSKITNDGLTRVWHRMLYSCTHNGNSGCQRANIKPLYSLPLNFMISYIQLVSCLLVLQF